MATYLRDTNVFSKKELTITLKNTLFRSRPYILQDCKGHWGVKIRES